MILMTPAWRDPVGLHEALDPAQQELLWARYGHPHRVALTRFGTAGQRATLSYLPHDAATVRLAALLPETLAALEEAERTLASQARAATCTADAQCLALVRRVLRGLREAAP